MCQSLATLLAMQSCTIVSCFELFIILSYFDPKAFALFGLVSVGWVPGLKFLMSLARKIAEWEAQDCYGCLYLPPT